jgi:hypothetical protein
MSVFGLISVFRAFAIPIGLMGGGMELGKILIIVYAHRHWLNMRFSHKAYYVLVVLALVSITSAEVVGTLSQSHSITGSKHDVNVARLASLESEREVLQDELRALEETLAALPKGYVSKRLNARKDAGYYEIRARLAEIERELGNLSETRVMAKLEAGPVMAISRIFNVGADLAILVFILALVGVVEPLSIGLTVAVSSVWFKQSPVVVEKEPPEPKVGKMSQSHVERIERKTAKTSGKATPEEVERAVKEHRTN